MRTRHYTTLAHEFVEVELKACLEANSLTGSRHAS